MDVQHMDATVFRHSECNQCWCRISSPSNLRSQKGTCMVHHRGLPRVAHTTQPRPQMWKPESVAQLFQTGSPKQQDVSQCIFRCTRGREPIVVLQNHVPGKIGQNRIGDFQSRANKKTIMLFVPLPEGGSTGAVRNHFGCLQRVLHRRTAPMGNSMQACVVYVLARMDASPKTVSFPQTHTILPKNPPHRMACIRAHVDAIADS